LYSTVEIDQWFWSLHGPDSITLPKSTVVREYAAATPKDFVFTVKAPNSVTLTHAYRKNASMPLVRNEHFLSIDLFLRFIDTLEPIRDKLGPLMLQFEYLNREKMPSLSAFLDQLSSFLSHCPRELAIGIETRNPNYLKKEYFGVLDEYGAHHVYLQGYYMPPIIDVYTKHASHAPSRSVLRLHGPDRAGMEKRSGGRWDTLLEKRDEELASIAAMVSQLLQRNIDVFVNVNNHYEGSAPLTIQRFRDAMQT